jgi:hypothetical protein
MFEEGDDLIRHIMKSTPRKFLSMLRQGMNISRFRTKLRGPNPMLTPFFPLLLAQPGQQRSIADVMVVRSVPKEIAIRELQLTRHLSSMLTRGVDSSPCKRCERLTHRCFFFLI